MIEDLWYKNTVIYSLDVETFMDSNGDGIGDFEGLMRRLDYLDSIRIDTIGLAPFYPSPNRDNGYYVSDFYGAIRAMAPMAISSSSCTRPTSAE
ncbi:MAG TPA: alpha-amylase family glycosyl hydrolase [Chthoniobacterales bacterium]|jgi:maltose alpha-D-glucosyltransferase/alpha-amylase|nr:alpha-amylase family glycosyl hydrolase [Chthoniobacterales bacterium]